MLRSSLRLHVPSLLSSGSLAAMVLAAPGCGRSLVALPEDGGESDDSSESNGTDPTDPSGPSTVTVDPSDPTSPTSDPTVDPTIDPTGPMPMPGPPVLIDAYFLDNLTLELVFSEPIATVGAIDTAKFRLSASSSNTYYNTYTWYADPGVWNGEEICNEYCYDDGCYEWCYTQPGPNIHIASIVNSAYAERVQLKLDSGIGPQVCEQLRQRLEQGAEVAAIFLHYSNNGPGIVDTDNEAMDALAEHWVLLPNQSYSYQPEYFPFMIPFVPIDCPF